MKKNLKLPILCIVNLALVLAGLISWFTPYAPVLPIILLISSLAMTIYILKIFFSMEEYCYREEMRKIYENSKHLSKD